MLKNGRLGGNIDQIELAFVEREATPEFLMKLSIQLHLSGHSLSNTVRVLEVFGVQRARSTVHNWVHKADLQPESGKNPDHVAVDETVIQLNDEQYWLYAAVNPETNELLHTSLEPTTNTVIAQTFLAEIDEKHDCLKLCFSLMAHTRYKLRVTKEVTISNMNAHVKHIVCELEYGWLW
jgi:hypothetical protein